MKPTVRTLSAMIVLASGIVAGWRSPPRSRSRGQTPPPQTARTAPPLSALRSRAAGHARPAASPAPASGPLTTAESTIIGHVGLRALNFHPGPSEISPLVRSSRSPRRRGPRRPALVIGKPAPTILGAPLTTSGRRLFPAQYPAGRGARARKPSSCRPRHRPRP